MHILKIQLHDTNREVTSLPRHPQARRDTGVLLEVTPGETASMQWQLERSITRKSEGEIINSGNESATAK